MSADHTPPRGGDDRGFALIGSLLAVVIVSGVVLVLVSTALGELKGTATHRDHEAAIHAAEAAVDLVAARAAADPEYDTGVVWPFPANPTPAQERQWARDVYEDALAAATTPASLINVPAVTCDDGSAACPAMQALGIRPAAGGTPLSVVYGVAAADTVDPQAARVIRIEIEEPRFRAQYAILTEGDLNMNGNPSVEGTHGNVHSNSDLNAAGYASGNVTSSGDLTGSIDLEDGNAATGSQPREDIPEFNAEYFYDLHTLDDGTNPYANDWYDLCPGGTIKRWSSSGPCNGAIRTMPTDWSFSGGTWKFTNGHLDGVYYVHEGYAEISGGTGSATFLVSAEGASDCTASSKRSGDIKVSGNPAISPFMEGVLLIADRDADLSGTASSSLGSASDQGFIGVGGTVELSGNVTVNGSIAARGQNACDPAIIDGDGVSVTSGNPTIVYDGGLEVELEGEFAIQAWNEL